MGACAQIAVFTFAYAANALLCLYSVAAWAQEIGTSFSVPFFRLSVGTDDRSKLLLYPSSASAWAQMTGASFSVPFFRLSVGTDDRSKLLCTLKPRFGALHTRFDDYTPRNENYRGLIDKI